MSDQDEHTTALFAEIDKENRNDYLTCSLSQAFDEVFQCYTLGSQAINYYRYGSKRDCSMKWEDFKFCMRTKPKSSETADAMIRERQKEKEAMRKKKRSSEEVWELRETK
ncbi:hypothetical protein BDB01DRAFT_805028 [Pilobolus umbonatus]|nr:hypothetical protein BDB01DRAFT_805028 [Pilobolus umbonatus]